jgi:serum/glucocorticoid-regulated kinase 2
VGIPTPVEQALKSGHQRKPSSNRESVQRRRCWWIPYVVLEYDKNEIMVDALGGQMTSPSWLSQADLCVHTFYVMTTVSHRSCSDVSRASDISVSAYLRTQPSIPGQSQADMGNDILLARLDLSPALEAHAVRGRAIWRR